MLSDMTYPYSQQQAWQPQPVRTTAPISLHLVAVAQYLGGLVILAATAVLGLAALDLFPRLTYSVGNDTWTNRPANLTPAVAIVCGVFFLVGVIALVLGRKLQRGRNWARLVLITLNALSVGGAAWQAFTHAVPLASALVAMALPALFLILLNTSAARSWCHRRTY
jgi:hypothetical protein